MNWARVLPRTGQRVIRKQGNGVTIEQKGRWLFGINAVINWLISIRGMVDPVGMASAFGGTAPNYPFMLRLWMGFVFMFGCMFWEVSRDPRDKHSLAKYNWIEKTITATAVTIGYCSGQVPPRLMILIVLTNWLWIPLILAYDIGQGRALKARQVET
jgi:hypothetical protein